MKNTLLITKILNNQKSYVTSYTLSYSFFASNDGQALLAKSR